MKSRLPGHVTLGQPPHLPFPNHVHHFVTLDCPACAVEGPEPLLTLFRCRGPLTFESIYTRGNPQHANRMEPSTITLSASAVVLPIVAKVLRPIYRFLFRDQPSRKSWRRP